MHEDHSPMDDDILPFDSKISLTISAGQRSQSSHTKCFGGGGSCVRLRNFCCLCCEMHDTGGRGTSSSRMTGRERCSGIAVR